MGENIFGIIGAGNQAQEILDFAPEGSVEFLLSSDGEVGKFIDGCPILNLSTIDSQESLIPVLPGVGAPGLKRKLMSSWEGLIASPVIASSAFVSDKSKVGLGSVIAPNAVLMLNAVIGKFVLINVGATVSHDTLIGDYSTVSPGVNVGGNCSIHEGVFLGIGATVIQGISIAPGTYVGAGELVTEDITRPGTYLGVPAKFHSDKNIWALKL